jgi:cysteinyl-tRNA synthetase
MRIELYNTLSRMKEEFSPIESGIVKLYSCGPTVYNYAHIGNLRTYIFVDTLRRALEVAGFEVRHVMNVTDVGHLESDSDEGDDKMILAARRELRSPWEVARFYEERFFEDCKDLNILEPKIVCRATEHIDDIVKFIECIEAKGHAYTAEGNVYFRVKEFPGYGELARLQLDQLEPGARVQTDPLKKDARDFVLWFSQSKYPNQIMKWESPWGYGFPGWHIECSAMASKYLGERIDIHTGGIDHIPIHHTNEIAQSESCLGHRWVNTWMHAEFLVSERDKMSKSRGSFLRLASLKQRGFDPLHYRYLCLTARYRSPLRFTWEAMRGARRGFENLKNRVVGLRLFPTKGTTDRKKEDYRTRFWEAVYDDLDLPVALAVTWEVVKDKELSTRSRLGLLEDFDRVLGFGVASFDRPSIGKKQLALIREREKARERKDWQTADSIRRKLLADGVRVKDTPRGTDWYTTFDD